jgi:hypothetical protein
MFRKLISLIGPYSNDGIVQISFLDLTTHNLIVLSTFPELEYLP